MNITTSEDPICIAPRLTEILELIIVFGITKDVHLPSPK